MAKRSSSPAWLHRLSAVLGHVLTRVFLSAAIIVSLLPSPWIRDHDLWFLLLFGPEFIARALLSCRAEWTEDRIDGLQGEVGWRVPRLGALMLLALDLVALISFVPLQPVSGQATRWLRLFRLARMLLLLRYWAPLARDLRAVLLRSERARQVGLMGLIVLVLSFAGAVVVDHLGVEGVDFDDDGEIGDDKDDLRFTVRLWWAFRQIQDPGNMLGAPTEAVTVLLSLALTVFGLFLISFLIGLGTDVVREMMELARLRPPGLRGHTVVVNIAPSTRQLLFELMRHYRKLLPEGLRPLGLAWWGELVRNSRRDRRYVAVGTSEAPPDFLREPELARVIYRQARRDEDERALLSRTDLHRARRIVLLADLSRSRAGARRDPDDETIRTLLSIVEAKRAIVAVDPLAHEGTRLVAEILDDGNLPAARRALATVGGDRVFAQIVATEQLLALFMGCVARRPGVSPLLLELMTSHGHEIYTYDYTYPTSVARAGAAHDEVSDQAMASIFAHGLAGAPGHRVVPLGLLHHAPGEGAVQGRQGGVRVRLGLSPGTRASEGSQPGKGARVRGLVALAPNFRVMAEFAQRLESAPRGAVPGEGPAPEADAAWRPSAPASLRRVLVCGFRRASVHLVESIAVAEPGAELLVLVDDDRARRAVLEDFEAHGNLLRRGLESRRRGRFVREGDDRLRYLPDGGDGVGHGAGGATVTVVCGDWSSSRQLSVLPGGRGSAADVDCVLLIASEGEGSDARTTTALMKLEALVEDRHGRSTAGPRIVAELLDSELATQLRARHETLGEARIQVFSIQALRAFFMFQSVVVPHFDLVYGELMGPWGWSFLPLEAPTLDEEGSDPSGAAARPRSFAELALRLAHRGQLLVGVELHPAPGRHLPELHVGGGGGSVDDHIAWSRLRRLWVVTRDDLPGPRPNT